MPYSPEDTALMIQTFANALTAVGIEPRKDDDTLSAPLAVVVIAHALLEDPRLEEAPSSDEILRILTEEMMPYDEEASGPVLSSVPSNED